MSTERQIRMARVDGLANGWATGTRDLDRGAAIAEIREITADADVLAEVAARFRQPYGQPQDWYPVAAQLVLDAGADLAAVERYAEARSRKTAGFDLGKFADRANRA